MEQRARLPETDDLWRLTMEHSPVGMALVSPAGEFLTANVALCDMLGYDNHALEQLTFRDITHPDDVAIDNGLNARALAGEISSYRITKRYVREDGTILVGDLSVALLRDDQGAPVHFISQIADLTERQAFVDRLDAAEAAVESEQAKVEAVFDSVSVGLLLLDAEGRYQTFNTRQREFLDAAFPEGHRGVAGQPGHVLDAEEDRRLTRDEMPSVRAAAGEEFDDLLVWVGSDPTARRALSISSRSLRNRAGDFAGAVLAYHDVTDLMRAVRVKDEFVSTVSHELRTPLAAALAYLELLEDSDIDADVRQQVAAARRNMMRLSHLVADLLFAARAGSGSPVIDPYRVDVAGVVAEALDAARVEAAGAQVELVADLPGPVVAVVDGLRLRQVLDNLLDNAIAYTPREGRVTVSLAAGERELRIIVADTGEGLEESDVSQMFGRFFRGANARRKLVPGTGLGLDIVRTIVEAHGGEVSATSSPGEGTSVEVVLPR